MSGLTLPEVVNRLETSLGRDYHGDFSKFIGNLEADELDLKLRTSLSVGSVLGPSPSYAPPPSLSMDGYETARDKHAELMQRCLMPTQHAAEHFNRTKGTIAGYGGFSSWSKYRALNATAMLNR